MVLEIRRHAFGCALYEPQRIQNEDALK